MLQFRGLAGMATSVALLAQIASADPRIDDLSRVLKVEEVVSVMRDEGVRYGDSIDADMLNGQGGAYFRDRVRQIYNPEIMSGFVREALQNNLDAAAVIGTFGFFDTELGQKILQLENAARVAMSDPAVEEIARATHKDLAGGPDQRLAAVARFIEVNDLLERNVASALSSNYHFFRGLAESDRPGLSQDDILTDIWAQEDELRVDTENWLFGFLLMAYRPLSDSELAAYIRFSESPEGQDLNAAFFDGFDTMYRSISFALGQATAAALAASDI